MSPVPVPRGGIALPAADRKFKALFARRSATVAGAGQAPLLGGGQISKGILHAFQEISTIRLFRRCDSWLHTPDPDRDPWAGKRHLSEEIREPLPIETLALAATTQPLVPRPLRCFDEPQETPKVATHAEVVEVASQTSPERGVLCLNRLMPMASTPVVDGLLGPSQARPPRLAPHPPVTLCGSASNRT